MANQAFLWGRAGEKLTPAQVEKEREQADLLAKGAMDYSPVSHWSQGLNRVAQGLLAGIDYRRADNADADIATNNKGLIARMLASQASPLSTPSAASSVLPMTGAGGEVAATGPEAYRNAIASIESAGSGDYSAIGPTNDKLGRPLGRYQIMEANLGPWSQAALGRSVTPDEFMADPKIQDAIFDNQFKGYVDKYGPEGAAQAWLGGPGSIGKTDRKDVLGTSVGEYGNRFMSALGNSPQAAIEAVSPTQGGSLSDEVAAFEQTPAYSEQFPAMGQQQTVNTPQQAPAVQELAQAQPMAQPSINPAIIEALSDPQATPQTRAIAQALLQQQQGQQEQAAQQQQWLERQRYEQAQQANDPLRRIQLEKGQLELDQARNPRPGSRILSTEEKTTMGLPPNGAFQVKLDGTVSQIGGGGVNITNEGSIPAGYQATRDEQGRVVSIAPIAGSPQAIEAQQAQVAQENRAGGKDTAGNVIITAAQRARDAMSAPGLPATGLLGKAAALSPVTNAAEVRRQIDVLKSNATIETLGAMRAASPTGGALGSVTEKEGAMLAAKAGALDPDSPNFSRDLDDYERTLLQTIHGDKVGKAIFDDTRKKTNIGGYQIEEVD
jgi:hypothetical protein